MFIEGLFLIGILIFLTDLFDTVGQLILKSSINKITFQGFHIAGIIGFIFVILKNPLVWIGFLLSGISLVVWLYVLTKAELGFAFSLDSMRYILIAVSSAVFLKEKLTAGRWMGILCVVIGIMLVAAGGKH